MNRFVCTALICLLLGLSACVRSLNVASTVALPARAPAFVFPSVWVAGGKYEEEVYMLDRIAAHLARDPRRQVRRLQAEELEPARQAGQIDWLTAVVRLSLTLRSSERLYSSMMPMQYCGPFGCTMTSYYSYSSYVPVLSGEVVLTVHEGPTARVLSHETFSDSVDGADEHVLRAELTERLAAALERSVDVHLEQVAFSLQQTSLRLADDGIALLSVGKHKEGRAKLEEAARQLGGQKKATQARVLHALAVARVFGAKEGEDLSAALRAARLALATDPHRRYRNSLTRIESLAKQFAVLGEQRAAAAHNFQLAQEAKK